MIYLFKCWWIHLHSNISLVFPNFIFWDELTDDMVAEDWRSPWGIMEVAIFTNKYGSNTCMTAKELYSVFCDEEKYIDYLKSHD